MPNQREIDWAKHNWPDLTRKLMLFSVGLLRRTGLADHVDMSQDLVHDAIRKTLEGQRRWDPERSSIFQFLAGVIKSDISNLRQKINRRRSEDRVQRSSTADYKNFINLEDFDGKTETPEDILIYKKQKDELLQYLRNIDQSLEKIANLMIEDQLSGSIEISDFMNISIDEVNNKKKRLRRAVQNFVSSSQFNYKAATR